MSIGRDAVLGQRLHMFGFARIASTPPAIRGLMVFRRPSSISGNPVSSDTSRTATPASCRRAPFPRGDNLHAQVRKPLGKIHDACFVCHTDECTLN